MKAVDITENPAGVDRKVKEQLEREKKGRFVRVDDKTMIFVREGDDIKSKVNQFKNKYNTKRRTL